MRARTRLLAVVTALVVTSVALTGCLFSVLPDRPSSSATSSVGPAPDTEGIAADLLPFYGQRVRWTTCGSFDCAKIPAPLDWDHPAKGTIELALIRHRATGRRAGSLLMNPGGPGASGVDFVRESLSSVATPAVERAYDIIGFDPRGVGASTAVTCFDNASQMDAYLFDIPKDKRGTAGWKAELLASDKGFADACQAHSNGILPYITTDFAARDMDLIRAVLGEKKLDYLGYSYGTFLGATYAKLYPSRVGRLVLDGALDPSVSSLGVSVAQGIGFESALRDYMAYCLKQKSCPFRGTVDDGMNDVGTLLAAVDRSPLRNGDGRMLGADTLVTAIVAGLYSQDSWPYITQMFTRTLKGDPSVAFQLADFYYNRVDGAYADNSYEAFNAYNCMDYPDDDTATQVAAAEAELAAKAPTIAPYWSVDVNICDVWPVRSTAVREKIAAAGAAPIVVVGTTGDPATPYAWAQSLASQLSSGVLITRVGEGHTGYNKGNTCVDDAVDAYLLDGTVPQNGLRCG